VENWLRALGAHEGVLDFNPQVAPRISAPA